MLALSVFLDLIDNKSDEEYFTWFYNKYRDLAKYVALPIVKDEFRAECGARCFFVSCKECA